MGDKDKDLSIKEYIDVIRLYLSDIIYNHKAQGKWRIHSDNTIIEHKTQGEWKIHLAMAINFISSKKDSDEMHKVYHVSYTCIIHVPCIHKVII